VHVGLEDVRLGDPHLAPRRTKNKNDMESLKVAAFVRLPRGKPPSSRLLWGGG
jgi:hypothetical protein